MLEYLDQIDFTFRKVCGATFLANIPFVTSDEQFSDSIRRSGGSLLRAEEDCNRFFVVQDFFSRFLPNYDYSEDDLINIARAYATRLKAELQTAYAGESFSVEIIGDDLVEDEPLELCVTFRSEYAARHNGA